LGWRDVTPGGTIGASTRWFPASFSVGEQRGDIERFDPDLFVSAMLGE